MQINNSHSQSPTADENWVGNHAKSGIYHIRGVWENLNIKGFAMLDMQANGPIV